jgi:dynein heavy chain
LPKLLTREGSNKELFAATKDGLLPSMTVFLLHEIERFNNLIKVMAMSIDTLKKALKGLAVMSEDIEKMQMSIYNNRVPELWANKAYPSLKPLSSWFQNLNERFEFLRRWLKKGNKIGGFWISSFFFP